MTKNQNRAKKKEELNGTGTADDPVILKSEHVKAVSSEYKFIRDKHGNQPDDWDLIMQQQWSDGTGVFDELTIRLADGKRKTYRFDITAIWKKCGGKKNPVFSIGVKRK